MRLNVRPLILSCVALAALCVPASADVLLDTTGQGGTGNNVIFSSIFSSNLILGKLNGQNDEVVRFLDLSNTGGFTGSANGNDIKIENTRNLDITVFDSTNLIQVGTTRDIFSIKGTGNLVFRVDAVDAFGNPETFNFTNNLVGYDLGNGNQQNGFDFSTSKGEVITDIDLFLLGTGGKINDFEHFRIDAAPIPTAAVPEASTWAMMIAGFLGIGGITMMRRRKEERSFRFA